MDIMYNKNCKITSQKLNDISAFTLEYKSVNLKKNRKKL